MYSIETIPKRLPIQMTDMEGLPRKLMTGVVTVVMGLVVIIIGIVMFGSTTGIAAYIDKIFADMGVKANITQTIHSLNLGTVMGVIGIVIVIIGFALIIGAMLEVGKSAQSLWRS
jgi:protein-S-isoprenylcysteine O-methyltransferase Ste14